MKLDKKQINIILFISFILLFIWGMYESKKHQKIIDEDISKNRYVTIARIKESRKGNSYTYNYYYDGKIYSGSCSCNNNDSITLVNRYFKVELSKKNPQYSNLLCDEEITDSTKIANCGFRKKTLYEILDSK